MVLVPEVQKNAVILQQTIRRSNKKYENVFINGKETKTERFMKVAKSARLFCLAMSIFSYSNF